ncbi:general transcription factor IIH subunit 2 Ssl1 [Tachypleus tridentatus]|uniref:general transcription factor IIH subunit 2 Ssl1 n=1 Tax=Tachypleus tridentatus TaxID=6853 RepID=UPI003FD2C6B6
MADDDDPSSYRWETEYEKTWESIQEDEQGLLQGSVEEILHRSKRLRLQKKKNVRLGMMRHLFVIVDLSEAMSVQDLKPTRHLCTVKILEDFIEEFFDQNPISQLGIIITRSKRAEILMELSGNAKQCVAGLKDIADAVCVGEPSLQNSLELAAQTLKHMPGHTSREIVIILGSLTTCDPSDICTTIEILKSQKIRCSVIGLAAELRICKTLVQTTEGTYHIILDEHHYKEVLYTHISPPPASGITESSLVRMGFPPHVSDAESKSSLCNCHLDSKVPGEKFGIGGYFCPQCHSKYCELPVECKACGLNLVSAPHLARSYHHLFPLEDFKEVNVSNLTDSDLRYCYGCQALFTEQTVYRCTQCQQLFCLECDLFIHDTLHTCPGCSSSRNFTMGI